MYKFVPVVVSGINFLCPDEKGTLCDSATVPAAVIPLSDLTISLSTVPTGRDGKEVKSGKVRRPARTDQYSQLRDKSTGLINKPPAKIRLSL